MKSDVGRKPRIASALLSLGLVALAIGCTSPGDDVSSGTGGMASGGAVGSGGNGTGGGPTETGSGGVGGSGGAPRAGSGGSTASGGAVGSGGVAASGGRTETGGSASGGASASGGTSATGGTPGSGGKPGSGGSAGRAAAGGAGGSAGHAGASGSGGATGTAGNSGSAGAGASTCNLSGAAGSKTPTVYVIGDSTASVYASNLYPRMGWAQPLQDYFAAACATIQDKALSGRSSKSFYDEGAWTPIRNALRAGDFVLIQFGHNDEKSDDATLFTDPFTTYEQYLSKYLDDTQAKGATPILLTSINRNEWSGGKLKDTHGDYPVAMRQLAQSRQISLVDTTALTKTYFERIGQSATTMLFMDLTAGQFPNYPDGNSDNTHLQENGARTIALIVLADLYRQGLPPGTLAKAVPIAPQ
ncbi:MAG TPA: rhamnogalacturonan acetylesterase [Polyangia bacterium]|jgi:lysophospholipase L1-like esterase